MAEIALATLTRTELNHQSDADWASGVCAVRTESPIASRSSYEGLWLKLSQLKYDDSSQADHSSDAA